MRAQSPSASPEMNKKSSIGMVLRPDPCGFVMCGQLSLLQFRWSVVSKNQSSPLFDLCAMHLWVCPNFFRVRYSPSMLRPTLQRSRQRFEIGKHLCSMLAACFFMEWNEGTQSNQSGLCPRNPHQTLRQTHGDAPCALVKSPNTSAAGGASPSAPGCPRRSNNEEAKARAAAQAKREPHRCIPWFSKVQGWRGSWCWRVDG